MTETPKSPRKLKIAAAVAAATALAGVVGYQALADAKPIRHAAAAFTHADWRGHGDAKLTPEEIDARIDRLVAHAAIEIDASDEQSAEIAAIAKAAAREVAPLRDAMRADARRLHDLLLEDVVNPSEVEAIRAARLAEFDAKSRIVAKAVTDIAAILTPEQRRTLEERIKSFRGHRGHWRH